MMKTIERTKECLLGTYWITLVRLEFYGLIHPHKDLSTVILCLS